MFAKYILTRHELFAGLGVIHDDLCWLESEAQRILVSFHFVEEGLCSVSVEELERTATLGTVTDTEYKTDITVNLRVSRDYQNGQAGKR